MTDHSSSSQSAFQPLIRLLSLPAGARIGIGPIFAALMLVIIVLAALLAARAGACHDPPMTKTLKTAILLFPKFETLDVMGPVEMLGRNPDLFDLVMVAERPGMVHSTQGVGVGIAATLDDPADYDVLLLPGGAGTRTEVDNPALHDWIREKSARARYVTTVCTGTALLARTGLLDGKPATTNKRAWDWVKTQGPNVDWVRRARWVEDGRFFTSSGVSAGTDMSLALIARIAGIEVARRTALESEYVWNEDPDDDPFA